MATFITEAIRKLLASLEARCYGPLLVVSAGKKGSVVLRVPWRLGSRSTPGFVGMASDMTGSFNILYEAWIPVLYADGRAARVGNHQALTDVGHIRQIAASNPMDDVALLRFLLAVVTPCRLRLDVSFDTAPGDGFRAHFRSERAHHV